MSLTYRCNKSLMVAAVSSAFGAPFVVQAQSSTVQVYGNLHMEYSYINQGRARTGGELNNVDMLQRTPGSAIGFKGEENLGGGLAAWFQCESTADLRGQDQAGWCTRNSALGFKGSFGNLYVGRWDTPMKRAFSGTIVGSNATAVFGSSYLLAGGSTSVIGSQNRGSFYRRQSNVINYDTPVFSGFQLSGAFSTAQTGTASLTTQTGAKPRLWSVGARYANGPLNIQAAYEKHDDFAGGAGGDGDTGWVVGSKYMIGTVTLGAVYTQQKFKTAVTESKLNAWQVGADWRITGPHGLRAAYVRAGDMKGTGGELTGSNAVRPAAAVDIGANLWMLQYVHYLSKRTYVTVGYSRLENEARARYTLGGVNAAVANGNTQDAWGGAIFHRF